jgi:hypothetical protein
MDGGVAETGALVLKLGESDGRITAGARGRGLLGSTEDTARRTESTGCKGTGDGSGGSC